MSRIGNLTKGIDDRINPIVVKELRQGVQGRSIMIIVNLLLGVLVAISVGSVMLSPDIQLNMTGGRELYLMLQGALFFASILLLPAYALIRLVAERNMLNVDLLFITTLTPGKIIRGKFLAGMTLVTMLYSVCLPFLLFTYLLRGFDIPSMLFTLIIGYLITATMMMAALTVGALATLNRALGGLLILAALGGLIGVAVGTITMTAEMLDAGVGFILSQEGAWWALAFMFTTFCIGLKILQAMGVGLLSPPASDRTCRLRVWSSVGVVFTGICAIIAASVYDLYEPVIIWSLVLLQLVLMVMIVATNERDGYSTRMLVKRPRNALLRFLIFPFTGGASGGICWAVLHLLLIGITVGVTYALTDVLNWHYGLMGAEFNSLFTWTSYVIGYIMLGRLMVRLLQPHVPTSLAWLMTLLVAAGLICGTIFISYLMDPMFWDRSLLWQFFNPFYALDKEYIRDSWLPRLCALITLALNLPWDVKNLIRFMDPSGIPFARPGMTRHLQPATAADIMDATLPDPLSLNSQPTDEQLGNPFAN